MNVTCANCGEIVEVPAELIGDNIDEFVTDPYICDSCENQRDLKADEADHYTDGFDEDGSEPYATLTVEPDAQPETVEALGRMMTALANQEGASPPCKP